MGVRFSCLHAQCGLLIAYEAALMFERSWVQIPATVYWLDIFSHLFIVKLYWMFEKTKNKWKEAGVGPFFKQFPAEKLATSSRSKTRKKLSRRWFQHFNEMLNFILNWQQQLSSQRLLPGGPPPPLPHPRRRRRDGFRYPETFSSESRAFILKCAQKRSTPELL